MEMSDPRRQAFYTALSEKSAAVYDAHPTLLYDHRKTHAWLTGALGDPFADVWFVAENPSLSQVERAVEATSESQWLVSPGDQLFRRMLVKHGFKTGTWDSPGGWRCYVTDVIKSADRAGKWNQTSRLSQLETARAWAPVLEWELQQSNPSLVVTVGKKADRFLGQLVESGHLPPVTQRMCIQHYSYVAMRPDGKLGPMHPERVAAYDAQFAAVASRAQAQRDFR
jgi:hypothetical protein